MARKAADKIGKSGPPREAIWAAIRKFGSSAFTAPALAEAAEANPKTVRDYLSGLLAAGYVKEIGLQPGIAHWMLVRDIGAEAPRVRKDGAAVTQGMVTEQLWRGMYMAKEGFTYADLIETASIEIQVDTAKAYCKMLLATGYLRVISKANPVTNQIARYRLIRNNGPKPPQIQRVKRVYDPNTCEVFMPEGRL